MSQSYQFTPQDGELLWAAAQLLSKVMGSGKIRPAQMVTLCTHPRTFPRMHEFRFSRFKKS